MPEKRRRFNPGTLVERLRAFGVSLALLLGELIAGKYALFQYELWSRARGPGPTCYLMSAPPLRWNLQQGWPAPVEWLVLIGLAGLVALRPQRAGRARRQLLQQLLAEGRLPPGVTRQL